MSTFTDKFHELMFRHNVVFDVINKGDERIVKFHPSTNLYECVSITTNDEDEFMPFVSDRVSVGVS